MNTLFTCYICKNQVDAAKSIYFDTDDALDRLECDDCYTDALDREELEAQALATVSPDLYYDLVDAIEEVGDEQLLFIIQAGGAYQKELQGATL